MFYYVHFHSKTSAWKRKVDEKEKKLIKFKIKFNCQKNFFSYIQK